MPSLKKIIRNIDSYTPEQLARFVLDGDCTVYELNKSGHITPLVKRQIEAIVATGNAAPEPAAEDIIVSDSDPTQLTPEIPVTPPPPPVWPMPDPDPDTSPAMRGTVRDIPPSPPSDGSATDGTFKAGHVFRPVSLFD